MKHPKVVIREREAAAVRLRRARAAYELIAQILGYSSGQAHTVPSIKLLARVTAD